MDEPTLPDAKIGTRHLYRLRVGVLNTILLPIDSEVTGAFEYLGEPYLEVEPDDAERASPRYFYAFADGEYMKYPDLATISSFRVGDYYYHVFEDDLCTTLHSAVSPVGGTNSLPPKKLFANFSPLTRKATSVS